MQNDYIVAWRCHFPLVRLSGRAIDFLLGRRRLASTRIMAIAPQSRPGWPNDGAFVACELHCNGFDRADCYDRTTFLNGVLVHPATCRRTAGSATWSAGTRTTSRRSGRA